MPKASVKEIKDTIILLDANSDLAGKKVIVTVKVISRSKEKSAAATGASVVDGAPTMQVFIMSHCPYGTQILKGLIPVMEKFNGKANVELRFVSYTMHGAQEELDNKRIICMREEQSSKLTDYLNCYVSGSGSEEDTQKCIAKVDKAKLDSCVASKADTYLEADKALNTEYGVQGSPTIVINGKEASIGRDSQSLATALCNAFTGSKPSVCSETFSTTSPSPGFGTSASSSSGGSCGA
jgi:glutaredoxin